MIIKKKQVYAFSAASLFILFISIVFLPTAYAAGAISDFPKYMLDTVNNGVINTIKENLTLQGNEFFSNMVPVDGAAPKSAAINALLNATYAVSMFIVIIISFVKYFEELERGADPKEAIYKALARIFMIGVFVFNLGTILQKVAEIGEWLIQTILDVASDPNNTSALTLEQITGKDSGGALWWMESVMILIIPWVLSLIMQVVAQFIAFSLLIELGIRIAFAPFAVVDIYSEGMRSPGMRYLKRYLATFIKIAICLLVCYLGNDLIKISAEQNIANFDSLGDCLQYVFRVIAINFTVLGVMAKTGEYANDVVGVGA